SPARISTTGSNRTSWSSIVDGEGPLVPTRNGDIWPGTVTVTATRRSATVALFVTRTSYKNSFPTRTGFRMPATDNDNPVDAATSPTRRRRGPVFVTLNAGPPVAAAVSCPEAGLGSAAVTQALALACDPVRL